ncbi:hypothetical protein [Arcicella rosea]|uniref:Uncharacterized protein n=1 Tax=Arcicella rosea TaxID=502909 RepID=A0A841EM89_9BACT|nr:hypothetical protein [Arcicella rosea]MBB6001430.1 hypothetical protein [Arcicella rosea]
MNSIQKKNQLVNLSENVLALRTNGRSIEVVAQGQTAKTLANIIAICLIAITVKTILK